MLNIDVLKDESLQGVLEKFISSLLPHPKYNPSGFIGILDSVFRLISLEEFSMEYYIMFKSLNELGKIRRVISTYLPTLSREIFEGIVESSIQDTITSPSMRVEEWLAFEGYNHNLEVETTKTLACNKLYERSLELFDRCFALEENTDTIPNQLITLKSAFIGHIGMQSIHSQVKIIQGTLKVGRRVYSGFNGWMEYSANVNAELKDRIDQSSGENSNLLILNSPDKLNVLLEELAETHSVIADYGIPELDDFTPILRHRFVVVVGMENIGKSKWCIDKAINIILAGGKVAYMCGETMRGEILSFLMVTYVYKKYDKVVLPEHIQDSTDCPEDVKLDIRLALAEVIESGAFSFIETLSYVNLYDQLLSIREESGFDGIFIDHSLALKGAKDLDNPIGDLALDCRRFKRDHPVYICVASHPSSEAKKLLSTNKPMTTSPTRGSTVLGEEADEVFILRDTPSLQKQNLIELEAYKRRGPKIVNRIVLQKKFKVNAFVYDKSLQASEGNLSSSAEDLLQQVESLYGEEEEDLFNID